MLALEGGEGRGMCNGEAFTAFCAAVGVSKTARMMCVVGWWVGFVVSYFWLLVGFIQGNCCISQSTR